MSYIHRAYGGVNLKNSVQLLNFNPATYNIEASEIASDSINNLNSSAELSYVLFANGSAQIIRTLVGDVTSQTVLQNYTWLLKGSSSSFFAFMDTPSLGSFTTGSAVNTSLQLNTNRSWAISVTNTTPDSTLNAQVISTLRIRNGSGLNLTSKSLFFDVTAINGTG
jgi:hypothetical protein